MGHPSLATFTVAHEQQQVPPLHRSFPETMAFAMICSGRDDRVGEELGDGRSIESQNGIEWPTVNGLPSFARLDGRGRPSLRGLWWGCRAYNLRVRQSCRILFLNLNPTLKTERGDVHVPPLLRPRFRVPSWGRPPGLHRSIRLPQAWGCQQVDFDYEC